MCHQLCSWSIVAFLCVFVDQRRKDFVQMTLHHIVTIGLVLGSFYVQEVRMGAMIAILHNLSDVFISMTKVFNYLKFHGREYYFATEVCFVLNMVSWITMRRRAW